jgi:heme exporter protein A
VSLALALQGLSCAAGLRTLFKGLDLQVHDGTWVKLTGPNGTGKTTLLRAIAGLVRPLDGQVLWRSQPRQAGSLSWNATLLYLGHASGWKDTLSARENLLSQLGLEGGIPSLNVATLLEQAGIDRQADLAFARLSAGQRKRLWLARLCASRRPLWLLDEPTNALDASGQSLFEQLLNQHLQRGGCAVIATHQGIASTVTPVALDLSSYAARRQTAPAAPISP